jgi:hypothetical protein
VKLCSCHILWQLAPFFFFCIYLLKVLYMSDPESFLFRCQELTDSGSPANVDVVCGEASREGGAADAARDGHQPTAR